MNKDVRTAGRAEPKVVCFAICLMALLKLIGDREASLLAADLQECIRVWQTVRLG